MTTVVFLLVPGLHLLDLAGPAQVFSIAAEFGLDYRLGYVAEQSTVATAQGLTVQAEVSWPALGPQDLVVVPGWQGDRLAGSAPLRPDTLAALVAHHAGGGTVASVCAGADALGRAGLLDGRRCTTHHEHQDELARRYPRATVTRDVLFTEDDRVVTSAGIASGIDLALHLVASRHGSAVAAQVARSMVVYARRNGDAQQVSAMLRHRAHLSDGGAPGAEPHRHRLRPADAPDRPGGRSRRERAHPDPASSLAPPASPRCATSRRCDWSSPSN